MQENRNLLYMIHVHSPLLCQIQPKLKQEDQNKKADSNLKY